MVEEQEEKVKELNDVNVVPDEQSWPSPGPLLCSAGGRGAASISGARIIAGAERELEALRKARCRSEVGVCVGLTRAQGGGCLRRCGCACRANAVDRLYPHTAGRSSGGNGRRQEGRAVCVYCYFMPGTVWLLPVAGLAFRLRQACENDVSAEPRS
jgi:hypothetical protein